MKDAIILGALVIITCLIGATTLSSNSVGIETGPAYQVPDGSGLIQWEDENCQSIGVPVFVPARTDPYVKGRIPDTLGSMIQGPSGTHPSFSGCPKSSPDNKKAPPVS